MTLCRRTLLASAAAAAAAAALPRTALAQKEPAAGAPIMKRRVPQTGYMLPVVGIGTSRVFEFENDPEKLEQRKQVVRALLAGGGSLIDTAAGYGTAEANVGTIAEQTGLRPRLFLATKYSSRDSHDQAEAEMRQSLSRLSDEERDMVSLKYMAGMKYREIGEVLGKSEEAVKTRAFRSLKKMKIWIANCLEGAAKYG